MKQERYTQAQVQAFENGTIITPERNIGGLKKAVEQVSGAMAGLLQQKLDVRNSH